jgi:hypothetical protein
MGDSNRTSHTVPSMQSLLRGVHYRAEQEAAQSVGSSTNLSINTSAFLY